MTMNKNHIITTICLCALLLTGGCATNKKALESKNHAKKTQSATGADASQHRKESSSAQSATQGLRFVQKVSDNAVYSKNIVSKIDFSVNTGGKNISVGGSIHMRKDEVIRIQLTPMGLIEVGRIELTPEYVLIMDRIHKEYIKAAYGDVDFLKNNGLNFYSLQALFWNQLFIPGEQRVSETALEQYKIQEKTNGAIDISLQQGNMEYTWTADHQAALINQAAVTYNSKQHGTSKLDWKYDDFKALGSKKFPANHLFTLSTAASGKKKNILVEIKMNKLTTDSDWETQTTVSAKYKKVTVEDVINKIMSL